MDPILLRVFNISYIRQYIFVEWTKHSYIALEKTFVKSPQFAHNIKKTEVKIFIKNWTWEAQTFFLELICAQTSL